jgi:hypothetical protein
MLKRMLLRPTQMEEEGELTGLVSEEEIMRRYPPVRCLPPQYQQEATGTAPDPANLFFAHPLPLLPSEVRERSIFTIKSISNKNK